MLGEHYCIISPPNLSLDLEVRPRPYSDGNVRMLVIYSIHTNTPPHISKSLKNPQKAFRV